MAHKKITLDDTGIRPAKPMEVDPEQELAHPSTSSQPSVSAPVHNTASSPVVPKKRIRLRPSQKKKLSVAVLCTNPMTRRFI